MKNLTSAGQKISRYPLVAVAASVSAGAIGCATLIMVAIFQFGFGIVPCPLCLEQRYAYYLTIPVAALTALAASQKWPRTIVFVGLLIIALAMFSNAGLGIYHAGIEWGWWNGPTECSGHIIDFGRAKDIMKQLETAKVIRCDEVQWRRLGLSLAGYNVIVSATIAAIAAFGSRTVLEHFRA